MDSFFIGSILIVVKSILNWGEHSKLIVLKIIVIPRNVPFFSVFKCELDFYWSQRIMNGFSIFLLFIWLAVGCSIGHFYCETNHFDFRVLIRAKVIFDSIRSLLHF